MREAAQPAHLPFFSLGDTFWKCQAAAKKHDVSVATEAVQVAEELEEHVHLDTLDDDSAGEHAGPVVWQNVALALANIRTDVCR